jgi:hypothetical protein
MLYQDLQNEAHVDKVEEILHSIRRQAEMDYNDSLSRAEYKEAEEYAFVLASTLRVENFVLEHTPRF